jgi:hypothetical protein
VGGAQNASIAASAIIETITRLIRKFPRTSIACRRLRVLQGTA